MNLLVTKYSFHPQTRQLLWTRSKSTKWQPPMLSILWMPQSLYQESWNWSLVSATVYLLLQPLLQPILLMLLRFPWPLLCTSAQQLVVELLSWASTLSRYWMYWKWQQLILVHAVCKFRLKEKKLDLEDWIVKVFTFAASVSVWNSLVFW